MWHFLLKRYFNFTFSFTFSDFLFNSNHSYKRLTFIKQKLQSFYFFPYHFNFMSHIKTFFCRKFCASQKENGLWQGAIITYRIVFFGWSFEKILDFSTFSRFSLTILELLTFPGFPDTYEPWSIGFGFTVLKI